MNRVQIILAGIGGQGILFASRLLSEWGMRSGLAVMGSETHGMSQRGGSVTAHLKLGDFHSPVIREGTADVLYSFEANETYRSLKFLKRGGACFVNLADTSGFNEQILDLLKEREIEFKTFDASAAAAKLGSVRSTNIILIGYSIGTGLVPFEYDDLRSVLGSITKKTLLDMNIKALDAGYRAGKR